MDKRILNGGMNAERLGELKLRRNLNRVDFKHRASVAIIGSGLFIVRSLLLPNFNVNVRHKKPLETST